jgi:hypothetical protein
MKLVLLPHPQQIASATLNATVAASVPRTSSRLKAAEINGLLATFECVHR